MRRHPNAARAEWSCVTTCDKTRGQGDAEPAAGARRRQPWMGGCHPAYSSGAGGATHLACDAGETQAGGSSNTDPSLGLALRYLRPP